MTRIVWDQSPYEVGVDRGVFYPQNGPAEPWNGLVSIVESPSNSVGSRYIDGVRVQKPGKSDDFAGTIEAFAYPDSAHDLLVTNQRPSTFGLSYRVMNESSYKIHLVYNVLIKPSTVSYEQNDPTPFSWEFSTRPLPVPEAEVSAHLIIDAGKSYSWTLEALENALYGGEENDAWLPSPSEIFEIFEENSIVRVIDHGDGTFTVSGPDEAVYMLDATTFEINWPSATYLDAVTYTIHSL